MLHNTHIGNMDKENTVWLNDQGILVRDDQENIAIADNQIYNALLERPVQAYSLFRWVVQDVQEKTGLLDINDIVTCMRTGSVKDRAYEMERIVSVAEAGIRLITESKQQKGGGSRKSDKF